MKSRILEIGNLKCRIALKFDRHIDSDAAEMRVNFRAIGQYNTRGFNTSRDLTIRRLIRYWNGHRHPYCWHLPFVFGWFRYKLGNASTTVSSVLTWPAEISAVLIDHWQSPYSAPRADGLCKEIVKESSVAVTSIPIIILFHQIQQSHRRKYDLSVYNS